MMLPCHPEDCSIPPNICGRRTRQRPVAMHADRSLWCSNDNAHMLTGGTGGYASARSADGAAPARRPGPGSSADGPDRPVFVGLPLPLWHVSMAESTRCQCEADCLNETSARPKRDPRVPLPAACCCNSDVSLSLSGEYARSRCSAKGQLYPGERSAEAHGTTSGRSGDQTPPLQALAAGARPVVT
jgi:hypothetical protein